MRKWKRRPRTGRKKSNCLLVTDLGAMIEEENQILCGAVLGNSPLSSTTDCWTHLSHNEVIACVSYLFGHQPPHRLKPCWIIACNEGQCGFQVLCPCCVWKSLFDRKCICECILHKNDQMTLPTSYWLLPMPDWVCLHLTLSVLVLWSPKGEVFILHTSVGRSLPLPAHSWACLLPLPFGELIAICSSYWFLTWLPPFFIPRCLRQCVSPRPHRPSPSQTAWLNEWCWIWSGLISQSAAAGRRITTSCVSFSLLLVYSLQGSNSVLRSSPDD